MVETQTSSSDAAFPNEPFACPYCGQMLAAACRVCVSCRQVIDPAKIQWAHVEGAPGQEQILPPVAERVRFPWPLFLILFFLRILVFGLVESRLGVIKTEFVLGLAELASSLWVLLDARQLRITRPFRWALGTLFLWPIVFPWYLARRKTPGAPCPFVEGIGLPIVFLVLLVLSLVVVLVSGPIK